MPFAPIKFDFLNPKEFPDWVTVSALWPCEYYYGLWFYDSVDKTSDDDRLKSIPKRREKVLNRLRGVISCYKSPIMKTIWEKVDKIIYKGSKEKSQLWFSIAIIESFPNPMGEISTKVEAEKSKADAIKKLKNAKDALNMLPRNMYDFEENYFYESTDLLKSMGSLYDKTGKTLEKFQIMGIDHPITAIDNAISALNKTQYNPGFSGKHVKGTNADRQHFIRSLTAAFFTTTGKKYRGIVADTASVIFDCEITEREVIRLTKSLSNERILKESSFFNHQLSEKHISKVYEESKIAERNWQGLIQDNL